MLFSAFIAVFSLLQLGSAANACLPEGYRHLNHHCVASSPFNRLLGVVWGEVAKPRQIAVLAGVSRYPNLPASLQLLPVDHDLRMLSDVLIKRLSFDEVIIIKNEDFNHANLRYVFENYLPDVLQENSRSRVLFAFSGHGSDFDDSGFLYFPETRTIKADRYSDLKDAINLASLKVMMSPTIRNAHQFLALVNACNGGYFLDVGMHFGANVLEERGAHGITAGGAKDAVHAYSNVGTGLGSVFFEMVAAALAGRDVTVGGRRFEDPAREDGILTTTKLANFLAETVPIIENYKLSPRMGALTGRGAGNQGEFFFVTDYERAKAALSRRFPREAQRVFGANASAAPPIVDATRIGQPAAVREQENRQPEAREKVARDREIRERIEEGRIWRERGEQFAYELAIGARLPGTPAEQEMMASARERMARERVARETVAREETARMARAPSSDLPPASAPRRRLMRSTAVRGNEYRLLPGVPYVEVCLRLCNDDPRCKMFQYWENKTCYLFDQEFETHSSYLAQSGYRGAAIPITSPPRILRSMAVRGNEYKLLLRTRDIEACSSQCNGDAQCKMFMYWENRTCYLFNQEFETYQSALADSGYKRAD